MENNRTPLIVIIFEKYWAVIMLILFGLYLFSSVMAWALR